MPLNVPQGFGLLAYRWGLASDPEVMVCTVGVDLGGAGGSAQDIADTKADAMETAIPDQDMAGGYTFLGCTLRVAAVGGGSVLVEAPRSVVGTAAASSVPNNCAYLVHKNTARAGRRGRGRMFLPPWVIAEVDVNQNGILTGAALTNLQSRVDVGFPLAGLVLLHDEAPAIIDPDPILSLVVDRQIATQRRRMR
jgi:hypothetical protein